MAKSPEALVATMIANLQEKTGRSLSQWLKIAKSSKLEKHGEIVKYLKSEHGLTHGYANLVTHQYRASLDAGGGKAAAGTKGGAGKSKEAGAKGTPGGTGEMLVAAQYAGAKAELKPIYDALLKAVTKFGNDVEISPKRAYASLRRSKQFALIQPSTKARVDVGMNLKGTDATDRLEASGSFNSMVSHRVRITDKKQVDKQLIAWLKAAYQNA